MRVRIFTDELDPDGVRAFTDYPLTPLTQASLRELMEIKTHTGLSGAQVERDYEDSIKARAAAPDDYDLSGDVAALRMVTCVIWLSRRRAGSKATLADAEDIRLDNWTFVSDADADPEPGGEDEADPTRPGSDGPETPDDAPNDPSENPPPPNSGPSTT